jgi:thiol-disulfide isomerase/thioredoxin
MSVAVAVLGVAIIAGLALLSFTGDGGADGTAATTAFDLPALTGSGRVQLASYRGTPVVVTLFASWCTACQQELPDYAREAASLGRRVRFIGVDSQETGNGAAFADRFHLRQSGFVLARDIGQSTTGGLYHAYGAHGLPLTAFYSSQGRLLGKANAALPDDVLRQKLSEYYRL